jgi:hypothetical protein
MMIHRPKLPACHHTTIATIVGWTTHLSLRLLTILVPHGLKTHQGLLTILVTVSPALLKTHQGDQRGPRLPRLFQHQLLQGSGSSKLIGTV